MLSLKIESYIWYGCCVALVACRILSRTLFFGTIKSLKIDDWLMILTLAPDTVLIVTINIVANTSSNLIAPGEDVNTFSQADRDERIYGSKLILVVEQMQCCTVWLVKACLLILYNRLTANLPVNIAVKALVIYVAVGFVVMEILYFGVWCRPFYNYWALPTPNIQCSAATNHLITNAVFNLSSDITMLVIGASLFIRSKLPWDRKLILCGIFGLGIFVILAAVLNKYYSFSHPFGSQWTYWYVRESSTAILVANLPFIWTLLRRMFKLEAFNANASIRTVPYHSSRSARGRHATIPQNGQSHTGGYTLNGSTKSGAKHGSHSSSGDIRQISPNGLPTSSKFELGPTKVTQQPSWRDQGLFGRGDLELMTDIDPWDSGNDPDNTPTTPPRAVTATCNRHSLSSGAPSPRQLRKLRDEEAQYALQEDVGQRFRPYEGPREDWSEEVESNTGEKDPDLRDEVGPNQYRKSSGSERRGSFLNKVAPPLFGGS